MDDPVTQGAPNAPDARHEGARRSGSYVSPRETKQPEHLARPVHVAVIMDGNGRWARQRNLPRVMGHQKGTDTVRMIKNACLDLKIPHLTLYAFSQENWKRPKIEVDFLMNLLGQYLDTEGPVIHAEGVRFLTIGDIDALEPNIQKKIDALKKLTRNNQRLTLTLALNYGSRQEIVTAAKRFYRACAEGASDEADRSRKVEALDEKTFQSFLDTAGLPDPDLLIRTSGEMRLSNFLLWQCSYSELYVSQKLWPDFSREDFMQALNSFAERERRFGAVL